MDSSSILFDLKKFWKIEELQSEKQDFSEKDSQLIKTIETEKDQLKCQIAGKCINEDRDSGCYMPHRAVIWDDKDTTRVRIVKDCSSKTNENNKSLNESLESGVNLYANLLNIILKFREKQVAFCGDLEKSFLVIEIAEDG
ncbi:uncharacterized protein NPIL_305181 [Nephila pilipes]|uniref:Uncharacterized protein n=1 Tax=Nephila pilipes TaxID=299642 RepID=A0A8X6N9T8_NEPPI|nr:uncharacterized protein NPIL_305181 [Nephila pilipes]